MMVGWTEEFGRDRLFERKNTIVGSEATLQRCEPDSAQVIIEGWDVETGDQHALGLSQSCWPSCARWGVVVGGGDLVWALVACTPVGIAFR